MKITVEIKKLEKHSDERGYLVEVLKNFELDKKEFGQIYVTTTSPNMVRANHHHKEKTEWMIVVKGKGLLRVIDPETKKVIDLELIGDDPKVVEISPNTPHAIKNIGNDTMILISYADKQYDKNNPDTYNESLF